MKFIFILMFSVTTLIAGDFDSIYQKDACVFTAKWCGACQQYEKTLWSAEKLGIKIQRIDVDKYPGLVKRYNITTIPTTIVIKNRKRAVGNISFATLLKLLE